MNSFNINGWLRYIHCLLLVLIFQQSHAQIKLTADCTSNTADLTVFGADNTPANTTITYHNGLPVSTSNLLVNPSMVSPGTYYAAFYSAVDQCFSPPREIIVTPPCCIQNECPSSTVDLTTAISSNNIPAGTNLTWHTGIPATDANRILSITDVGAGTYYAAFHDAAYGCYSGDGYGVTEVVVDIVPCCISPDITSSSTTDEICNGGDGSITFNFTDDPNQSTIFFSLDGGASYPYSVADDAGTFTINNLAAGTYDLYVSWLGGVCSLDIPDETIENEPAPVVMTSSTNLDCISSSGGSITFTFTDVASRTGIEFSLDGGNTYPYVINDNMGSYSIMNLGPGTYDLWVRWYGGDCPIDIPDETINDLVLPTFTCEANIDNGGWTTDADCYITVCEDQEVELRILPDVGQIDWTGPNGFSAADTNQISLGIVLPINSGDYNATYTDPNGCTVFRTFVVNVESTGVGQCSDTENTPLTCSDGFDNDGDGLIDCDDPDCQAINVCNSTLAYDDINITILDTPVSGNVLTNDEDIEGNVQTVSTSLIALPTNGTVTINSAGLYTYTPNTGYVGEDQFVYEVCDDGLPQVCDVATVFIEIMPIAGSGNLPPIAIPDYAVTVSGITISGILSLNDYDVDDASLIVTTVPVDGPSNGTVFLFPNGNYVYTPNAGFVGTDTLVYEVCDNGTPKLCDSSTLIIEVLPAGLDNATYAFDDVGFGYVNEPISGNIKDNDIDLEGHTQSFTALSPIIPPSNGTVTLGASGNFIYIPNTDFVGNDEFVYEICDNGTPVACDQATVYLTVQPIYRSPKAFGDLNATLINIPVSGNVLTNDMEPDGQGLVVTTTVLGGPSSGSILLLADGSYTYTPNNGFSGQDSLLYIVCDDFLPPACDTGILKIIVSDPNEEFVLLAQDDYYIINKNQQLTGQILGNDKALNTSGMNSNSNNITLNFPVIRQPKNGTLNLQPSGDFTYLPNLDFVGEDEFEYAICSVDVPTLCDTAIVYICIPNDSPSNEPPFAADDIALTFQNTPVQDTLLLNDFDVDGDNLLINPVPITQPTNGTISYDIAGVLIYTPNPDYIGPDNFIYEICDTGTPQLCAQGTYYVLVLPLEMADPPVAVNDDNVTFINVSITGQMLTNDFDPNGDSLAVQMTPIDAPNNGTVVINADGSYTYTPNTDYIGIDYFEYAVCEITTAAYCDTARVNIHIIPNGSPNSGLPPIAMNDENLTYINMPVNGNVLANDLDPEGTVMTVSGVVIQPTNGVVSLDPMGIYTYTPNTDFIGDDQFMYLACDGGLPVECVFATVYIQVLPIPLPFNGNFPPVAADDFNYTKEETTISGRIGLNDHDPENDVITLLNVNGTVATAPLKNAISLDNGTLEVEPNGEYTYLPNPGFYGIEQFTYEITDGQNRCSRATVYIAVDRQACIDVQLKVFLEGAMVDVTGNQDYLTEMRADLNTNRSILPGQTPFNPVVAPTPAGQPYNVPPFNYTGTDTENTYAGPYDPDVVDWVLVSLRSGVAPSTEFSKAAGLLHKDGTISFLEPCMMIASDPQTVYIVIEHRNHMGIMTPIPVTVDKGVLAWDFTTQNGYLGTGGFALKEILPNTFAMYTGDNDQASDSPSYDITGLDKILWTIENGNFDKYLPSDFDMNGDVNGADKILWSINNGTSSRVYK